MSHNDGLDIPVPRDFRLDPISAPLVTSYSLKALIDSPQFHQSIVLPSGRTVSYTACGSKTGTPILYFYGLGGSSRQIASLHSQAVRLDIRLLCIDRPGTGYTEPYKHSSSSTSSRRKPSNNSTPDLPEVKYCTNFDSSSNSQLGGNNYIYSSKSNISSIAIDSEGENNLDSKNSKRHNRFLSFSSSIHKEKFQRKRRNSAQSRTVNPRVHFTCLEALAVVDQLMPGARFGLMGHSCGIYYIMHMLNQFPSRIQHGPIALLTPWVPFKECPETTSKTFKFLKHIPKGLVWAVTSSMNHIGSALMSSSNALSGALSNKDLNGGNEEDLEEEEDEDGQDIEHRGSRTSRKDSKAIKKMADPFIVQFSEAFDKIIIPALVQDMNRQHSNGYNSEIQMCVTDVGFDIADIELPEDITINAYFGYLDTIVPIEASREMGRKCGWATHEFRHSGHGGPRMSMYALEDYIEGLQAIEVSKASEEQMNEKQGF